MMEEEKTSRITCKLCPHCCVLRENQTGFCRARAFQGGRIVSLTYGRVFALALDPIEKKPLRNFYPGSMILSVGGAGCNLRCPFCQNHDIAQEWGDYEGKELSPKELVELALSLTSRSNIGLAFTYNEPVVGYEYVYDCVKLAHQKGLMTVLVTNGMINQAPLMEIMPYIDAMNIDLKGFTEEFYKRIKGDLETVKNTIMKAQEHCHVEVTTLIIPGENDRADDMERQSAWLSSLRPDIPLHLSRFFPRYHYSSHTETSADTLWVLANIARKHLRYVYLGNV